MTRALHVVATLVSISLFGACGGNPGLDNARSTVATSSRVLTDLDQRTSRGPIGFGAQAAARARDGANDPVFRNLRAGVVRAQRSLHDAEEALDQWVADDDQSGNWTLRLPCLAASLSNLLNALTSFGVEPGVDLEQLVTTTNAETNGSVCVPSSH